MTTPPPLSDRLLQTIRELQPRPGVPFSDRAREDVLAAAADQRRVLEAAVEEAASSRVADARRAEVMARALAAIDWDAYRAAQEELLVEESVLAHAWRLKYLNITPWLRAKTDAALRLGLDGGPPLTVLDIGVGPGHFPFVCQLFGHRVIGTDLMPLPLGDGWDGPHVYDRLIELFDVDRRPLTVEARTAMPSFDGPVDLVTALMVKFDNPPGAEPWGPSEWAYWIGDVRENLLRPGGRILLQLNRPFAGREVLDHMRKEGGVVDEGRCTVLMTR